MSSLYTLKKGKLSILTHKYSIITLNNGTDSTFQPRSFIDPSPNHNIAIQCHLYFTQHNYTHTKTLPASLTTVTECASLAGLPHITIPPPLLKQLTSTTATHDNNMTALLDNTALITQLTSTLPAAKLNLLDDEERFRILFTLRDGGRQEIKQVKAINVFVEMQVKLEEIVRHNLS